MGYLRGYDYDIFVSYAHVDNEPFPGVSSGWVSTLLEGVEIRLKQQTKFDEDCEIWFDRRLAGNAPLTESITASLEKTAILLIIMSRGYLKSEWCQRERREFLEMAQDRTRKGWRVFLVELDKIEVEERPPELQDCKGYQFWTWDRECNRSRRLGLPQPRPDDGDYWSRVYDLGYELATELDRNREQLDSDQEQPSEKPSSHSSAVFLAESTEDLLSQRNSLARSLRLSGYRVLPDDNPTSYPRAAAEYEAAVKEDLNRCDLFVQLLSELVGRNAFWHELPQGFVRAQYDWAVETDIEMAQWREQDLDVDIIEDEAHQKLLRSAEAVGLEEFKRTVERKLDVVQRIPQSVDGAPAWLHINSDEKDESLSEQLCESLEKTPVGYDLDETDDLEYVRQCWDGIIFVYGEGDVGRLGGRIRKWYKLASQIDREPPLSLAVYLGPPADKPRLRVRPPNLVTINCVAGLNKVALLGFVQHICRLKAEQMRKCTRQRKPDPSE